MTNKHAFIGLTAFVGVIALVLIGATLIPEPDATKNNPKATPASAQFSR